MEPVVLPLAQAGGRRAEHRAGRAPGGSAVPLLGCLGALTYMMPCRAWDLMADRSHVQLPLPHVSLKALCHTCLYRAHVCTRTALYRHAPPVRHTAALICAHVRAHTRAHRHALNLPEVLVLAGVRFRRWCHFRRRCHCTRVSATTRPPLGPLPRDSFGNMLGIDIKPYVYHDTPPVGGRTPRSTTHGVPPTPGTQQADHAS